MRWARFITEGTRLEEEFPPAFGFYLKFGAKEIGLRKPQTVPPDVTAFQSSLFDPRARDVGEDLRPQVLLYTLRDIWRGFSSIVLRHQTIFLRHDP